MCGCEGGYACVLACMCVGENEIYSGLVEHEVIISFS